MKDLYAFKSLLRQCRHLCTKSATLVSLGCVCPRKGLHRIPKVTGLRSTQSSSSFTHRHFSSHTFDPSIVEDRHATAHSMCRKWQEKLRGNNVPEARSSVEYIVAFVLGKKTLQGVDEGYKMNADHLKMIDILCGQRMQHEPVQYILGEWDFSDIELKLRSPVFIPRPETEELVGLAESRIQERNCRSGRLLEFCCGSGAISLALLHKFPQLSGVAVDSSEAACDLTRENAHRLGVSHRLTVIQGKLADDTVEAVLKNAAPFDLVVSNPPYIPTCQLQSLERQILRHEDVGALDGGADGLDVVRDILRVSPGVLRCGSDILLEIQPGQPGVIQHTMKDCRRLQFVSSQHDYLDRENFVILPQKESRL